MQDIEQSHVAAEVSELLRDIVFHEADPGVTRRRNARGFAHLPNIDIEADDRLLEPTLAQIKRQQTNAATDVEDGLR
jgi:hypothetical protein